MQSTATMTSKGQITIPKQVRQALNIDVGSKVVFDIHNNTVTLSNIEQEQSDPCIQNFLELIASDIAQGNELSSLNEQLVQKSSSCLSLEDIENLEFDEDTVIEL